MTQHKCLCVCSRAGGLVRARDAHGKFPFPFGTMPTEYGVHMTTMISMTSMTSNLFQQLYPIPLISSIPRQIFSDALDSRDWDQRK